MSEENQSTFEGLMGNDFEISEPKLHRKETRRYNQLHFFIFGTCLLLFGYTVAYAAVKRTRHSPIFSQVLWPPNPLVSTDTSYLAGVNPVQDGKKRFNMKDWLGGQVVPRRPTFEWLPFHYKGEDGWYLTTRGDNIVLQHVDTRKSENPVVLASLSDLRIPGSQTKIQVYQYFLSADANYLILLTQKRKKWRYSFHAVYYIYDIKSHSIVPLLPPIDDEADKDQSVAPPLQYVSWSPTGHSLAFVYENNLYFTSKPGGPPSDIVQITKDGSLDVFNAVPDWIYEEEVFAGPSALWWSPNSKCLCFLKFNESLVPTYEIPMYDFDLPDHAYTDKIKIKYPKAGFPNPFVSAYIYDIENNIISSSLKFDKAPAIQDRLIVEILWQSDQDLIIRINNRNQDLQFFFLFSQHPSEASVWDIDLYRDDSLVVGHHSMHLGWYDKFDALYRISDTHHLDINLRGKYLHLALYKKNERLPLRLTDGEYNVEKIVGYDKVNQFVYYVATLGDQKDSVNTERHLFRVKTDNQHASVAITSMDKRGNYDAKFSPSSKYYVLQYNGPGIPWTKIRSTIPGEENFEVILEENEDVQHKMESYSWPEWKWVKIPNDLAHYEFYNGQILFPPQFNTSYRYPVLFDVYGGPGTQKVTTEFAIDFHTVLASHAKFPTIVVRCDGRGTSGRGTNFLFEVSRNLGDAESEDTISCAKWVAKQPWADPERIAVWGWSYGGYLTTKIVEKNGGDIFKTAVAVAPVTDWRFYDSIYTERYMKSVKENQKGYDQSSVHVTKGFDKVRYLLMHGTGDDNVHFQNAASLIHALIVAHKTHVRSQFFPDDDHSMSYGQGRQEIYQLLIEFLYEGWRIPPDALEDIKIKRR